MCGLEAGTAEGLVLSGMHQRNDEEKEEEESMREGREGVGGTTGEFTTGSVFYLLRK